MPYAYRLDGTLLSIENVHHSFDGKLVLRGVTASEQNIVRDDVGVQQGQVIGLLGPSGCGKTTLLRSIAGFLHPDVGRVLVGTKQEPTHRGKVGVVSQQYRIFNHRRVIGNLVYAGRRGGLTKAEAHAKAEMLLERFDLLPQKNFWPGQLSGGQRQRVAILQQIMAGHGLICMDEPFSGLDPDKLDKMIKLIREITSVDEHLTIVVVTHDIAAAVSVADHLWLMGHHQDDAGKQVPGATIVSIYDLIALDLAWQDNIRSLPQFRTIVDEITERFKTL